MIGRKSNQLQTREQLTCEICGNTNKGLKLERHEGVALLVCNKCREFGIQSPTKKRKTSRDKTQSNAN